MRILCWRLCSRGMELTNNISLSITDLFNDLDPLYLNSTSFMFGVALGNDINNTAFDDTYLSIKLKFNKKLNDVNFIEIPFEKWTISHFPQFNQSLFDYMSVEEYLCPKNLDFYLQGNYFSDLFSYISLEVSKWVATNSNGIQCKSQTEIDSYINNLSLGVFATSAYFDFNDYDKPIKYFINDRFYYYLISDMTEVQSLKTPFERWTT